MITGITIKNFKGIREAVNLDFRPITLLFGGNSAGKSTILHALHYAREIFERNNLDADKTVAGGAHVDLGGFKQFANNPDEPVEITIRLSLDDKIASPLRDREDFDNSSLLFHDPRDISVVVAVAWSAKCFSPVMLHYTVYFDGVTIGKITFDPDSPFASVSIDLSHPAIESRKISEYGRYAEFISYSTDNLGAPLHLPHDSSAFRAVITTIKHSTDLGIDTSLVLDGEKILVEVAASDAVHPLRWLADFFTPTIPRYAEFEVRDYTRDLIYGTVDAIFSRVHERIHGELRRFRYVGPLRELPPRNYQPPNLEDPTRWASGLGAWDRLQNGPPELAMEVSGWLDDADKLNAGIRIEQRSTVQAGRQHRQLVIINSSKRELKPNDVGIGFSQVIPVIVTSLDDGKRLLAVEQPELHVHPRLQACLADLFIEAIHNKRHQFIIETHSEHLVLRLLRRIRESESNKAPANRKLRTDELAIYYLQFEEGSSRATEIEVDIHGEFIQPWPDDFFEIDFHERFPDAR